MKLPNTLFILLLIFSIGICLGRSKEAKKENENIASQYNLMNGADIRAMVQLQIDSARARDFRGEIKSCVNYINRIPQIIYADNKQAVLETGPFITINPKVLVIGGFSVLVFLIVFVRRIIKNHNIPSLKHEHEIINLKKKEEAVNPGNPNLDHIRNKFVDRPLPEIRESSFPGNTKGMKIAQGEVILAAKIKSYELAHFGNK
jgi:hypothetical protein